MDPQASTSFIPKKPLDTGMRRRSPGFGLFFLLALLIFIASLVAAGSAFLYTQYLQKSLADKSHSLELAQGAYDPSVIEDLLRLDTRITQAQTLLGKHTAASALFAFLSTQTLEKVSFGSFNYALKSDGSATITLGGEADSFSTVALQSDQFGGNKMLKDVVFSGITVGNGGSVSFSVTATVNPTLLQYSNSLGSSVTVPPPSNPTASSTTPTPSPTGPQPGASNL